MKIAIIVRRLNVRGGTQRQALELGRELARRGHEVKIYTFLYSKEDCFSELLGDIGIVSLDYYPRQPNFLLNYFSENRAAHALSLKIDLDTDILNPHDQVSYRVAAYFKKKIRNIPSVWMSNDLPTKYFSFWKASQANPGLSVSLLKKFLWRLFDWYETEKFIKPQDAVTVLDNMNNDYVRRFIGKDAEVIRSGLDLKEFKYISRNPPQSKAANLLCCGIFFPHRRFEDAVLAVKKLRDQGCKVNLNIVGDSRGDKFYYNKIVKLIDDNLLSDSIRLIGVVSDEELRRWYETSDIFIFPNHLQTWGLVVFEAMATGLPAVVSKSTGAAEVLHGGKNAILVNPESPDDLAGAVRMLIDDHDLYQQLSKNSRAFVERNLSWGKYADGMLKVFESVLAPHK